MADITESQGRADTRLGSIDILRGLAIVLMALDHVRDYFTQARFDPVDLSLTDPALFLTRWVTHFCAPIFILLAGVSARLMSRRMPLGALSRFLLLRGLWLIVLECTVITFAWTFDVTYYLGAVLQVIWVIGVSMVAMGLLVYLPTVAILTIGVVMIAAHNLFDQVSPTSSLLADVWHVLHSPGGVPGATVLYPLIPWVGVMAVGYVAGGVFSKPRAERVRTFVRIGLLLLVGFVALRFLNGYGDPGVWSVGHNKTTTILSFLNTSKYPPSLLFLLMTLSVGFLALGLLETARGWFFEVLQTFGRAPLFFYVVHLYLIHLAAGLLALALGFGTSVLAHMYLFFPDGWGYSLWGVYAVWLSLLALLYLPCVWFSGLKQRRRDWWLSYL